MIAIAIILVILILLLSLKVGVDVSYLGGVLALAVKAGPLKIAILPKKEKPEGEKKEKKKKKKPEQAEAESEQEKPKKEKKKGPKLTLEDILEIARLALKAVGRFFGSLRMDYLLLHLTTAGPDPYSAVMNYGYFNAALGALLPLLRRIFKIGREDISSQVDFDSDKLKIDAGTAITIRIGQILFIALCAVFAFLRWLLRRRRRIKAEQRSAAAEAKKQENNNTQPEKGQ